MRRLPIFALALTLALVLPACGGGDEDDPAIGDNPFGDVNLNELAEQNKKLAEEMKKGMPDFSNMPDPNDKEAMKEWSEKMSKNAADMFKNMDGSITEAELDKWYKLAKSVHDAKKSGGDKAAAAAAFAAARSGYAMLTIKVSRAMIAYEGRKQSGQLTEADKKNAVMFEKYKKLLDELNDN